MELAVVGNFRDGLKDTEIEGLAISKGLGRGEINVRGITTRGV